MQVTSNFQTSFPFTSKLLPQAADSTTLKVIKVASILTGLSLVALPFTLIADGIYACFFANIRREVPQPLPAPPLPAPPLPDPISPPVPLPTPVVEIPLEPTPEPLPEPTPTPVSEQPTPEPIEPETPVTAPSAISFWTTGKITLASAAALGAVALSAYSLANLWQTPDPIPPVDPKPTPEQPTDGPLFGPENKNPNYSPLGKPTTLDWSNPAAPKQTPPAPSGTAQNDTPNIPADQVSTLTDWLFGTTNNTRQQSAPSAKTPGTRPPRALKNRVYPLNRTLDLLNSTLSGFNATNPRPSRSTFLQPLYKAVLSVNDWVISLLKPNTFPDRLRVMMQENTCPLNHSLYLENLKNRASFSPTALEPLPKVSFASGMAQTVLFPAAVFGTLLLFKKMCCQGREQEQARRKPPAHDIPASYAPAPASAPAAGKSKAPYGSIEHSIQKAWDALLNPDFVTQLTIGLGNASFALSILKGQEQTPEMHTKTTLLGLFEIVQLRSETLQLIEYLGDEIGARDLGNAKTKEAIHIQTLVDLLNIAQNGLIPVLKKSLVDDSFIEKLPGRELDLSKIQSYRVIANLKIANSLNLAFDSLAPQEKNERIAAYCAFVSEQMGIVGANINWLTDLNLKLKSALHELGIRPMEKDAQEAYENKEFEAAEDGWERANFEAETAVRKTEKLLADLEQERRKLELQLKPIKEQHRADSEELKDCSQRLDALKQELNLRSSGNLPPPDGLDESEAPSPRFIRRLEKVRKTDPDHPRSGVRLHRLISSLEEFEAPSFLDFDDAALPDEDSLEA